MNFSSNRDFWLLLNNVFHRGNTHYERINNFFYERKSVEEFKKRTIPLIEKEYQKRKINLDNWLVSENKKIAENSIDIITILDNEYPQRLKNIDDPPFLLYSIGRKELLNSKSVVSIVGSRKCNAYGAEIAEKFGNKLAQTGIIVVSGMALGIDKMAHIGALKNSGNTVAVLGTSIINPYPRTNFKLYEEIKKKGIVISEFPLDMRSYPNNFPIRNRIVAGLSDFTIIVQATLRSGTLITARLANEYGRELFAVPGDIRLKLSEGVNKLILEGAIPALNINQILYCMGLEENLKESIDNFQKYDRLTLQEKRIIALIRNRPMTIDELAVKSKMKVSVINALVIGMEVDGIVKQESGRRVVLVK